MNKKCYKIIRIKMQFDETQIFIDTDKLIGLSGTDDYLFWPFFTTTDPQPPSNDFISTLIPAQSIIDNADLISRLFENKENIRNLITNNKFDLSFVCVEQDCDHPFDKDNYDDPRSSDDGQPYSDTNENSSPLDDLNNFLPPEVMDKEEKEPQPSPNQPPEEPESLPEPVPQTAAFIGGQGYVLFEAPNKIEYSSDQQFQLPINDFEFIPLKTKNLLTSNGALYRKLFDVLNVSKVPEVISWQLVDPFNNLPNGLSWGVNKAGKEIPFGPLGNGVKSLFLYTVIPQQGEPIPEIPDDITVKFKFKPIIIKCSGDLTLGIRLSVFTSSRCAVDNESDWEDLGFEELKKSFPIRIDNETQIKIPPIEVVYYRNALLGGPTPLIPAKYIPKDLTGAFISSQLAFITNLIPLICENAQQPPLSEDGDGFSILISEQPLKTEIAISLKSKIAEEINAYIKNEIETILQKLIGDNSAKRDYRAYVKRPDVLAGEADISFIEINENKFNISVSFDESQDFVEEEEE